jgi:hypothetical protein
MKKLFSPFLPLNIQHFANGGDQGDQQADNQAGGNDQQQDQTQQTDTAPEKAEDKTFTQDDVNKIAAKEKRSAREAILKELGIEDFENAKDGMEKFKEWQESQKTEREKLDGKLSSFEKEISKKDTAIADLQAENEAIKAGITDEKNLEAVITLAKTKVNEEVDIKEAIKQVVEDYPHFAGEKKEESQQSPQIVTPGNPDGGSNSNDDPFAAKLAKYN